MLLAGSRRTVFVLCLGVLGCILPGGLPLAARAGEGDTPDALRDALKQVLAIERELISTAAEVRKFTVTVWNMRIPRQQGQPVEGAAPVLVGGGSGVIVEKKRKLWVITNVHVIDRADRIEVITDDGVHREMLVHDTIAPYDIALLAFPRQPRDLEGFTLNPSKLRASRDLQLGAWVVATGNPFHLATDGQAVTTLGVVSGKDRILGGQFLYGSAIQHDAEVNPGNSGGPLWNRMGDLIGINGMIATRPRAPGTGPSNTGASFSIPIHQVNAFLTALIEQGTDASAGFLGLEVKTHTDERGNPLGAVVEEVHPKSPAGGRSRSALQPGDVITTIWGFGEDHRIHTASDVTNLLSLARAGSYLKIKYKRGRRYYEWSGRLTERPRR